MTKSAEMMVKYTPKLLLTKKIITMDDASRESPSGKKEWLFFTIEKMPSVSAPAATTNLKIS